MNPTLLNAIERGDVEFLPLVNLAQDDVQTTLTGNNRLKGIRQVGIGDEGAKLLANALQSPNCKVTSIT